MEVLRSKPEKSASVSTTAAIHHYCYVTRASAIRDTTVHSTVRRKHQMRDLDLITGHYYAGSSPNQLHAKPALQMDTRLAHCDATKRAARRGTVVATDCIRCRSNSRCDKLIEGDCSNYVSYG